MRLSPEEVKSKISPELIRAAELVFVAKAHAMEVGSIVEANQKKVLAAHNWPIARQWVSGLCSLPSVNKDRVILEPSESFLLEDEDFKVYLDEVKALNEKDGLKVDNPDHCPKLIAESHLTAAEHNLIDEMKPITGVGVDEVTLTLEFYNKYIDLCLKLVSPWVREGKEILAEMKA